MVFFGATGLVCGGWGGGGMFYAGKAAGSCNTEDLAWLWVAAGFRDFATFATWMGAQEGTQERERIVGCVMGLMRSYDASLEGPHET